MGKTNRGLATSHKPTSQGNDTNESISPLMVVAWFAVAIYLIYEISVVELTEVPQPFWDWFPDKGKDHTGIAIFYIFGLFLLAPAMGLLAYIVLKFAVTMLKEGLLKLFPVSWVAVLLPLVFILALVPGFSKKHEIKLWAMSAGAQVDTVLGNAQGIEGLSGGN